MVRTLTIQTVYVETESGEKITRDFVGTSWTPKKMISAIKDSATYKKDESGKPEDVVSMSTETKFQTFSLSDAAFMRAALKEMQSGAVDGSDKYTE